MAQPIPFRLSLTGDTADNHEFQGYDGYMALAGFAWTLSLITHYAETGKIRHRGDFLGRDSVRATALAEGSILADFTVLLQVNASHVLGLGALPAGAIVSAFLYDLVKRVIARNLGHDDPPDTALLARLLAQRGGDVEALVARVEPAVRQTHSVIGNGATKMQILGGHNIINTYDESTRDYVKLNVRDDAIQEKDVTVAAFSVNSGNGSIFDDDLGRTISISTSKEALRRLRSEFSWGLDQYANRTGRRVRIKYTRILAMDGTPKRYIVIDAKRAAD